MSVPLPRPITLIALFALCFAVAGYAIFAYGFLPLGSLQPSDMRATFLAYPVVVYLHVFGAIFALVLGPFQFWAQWRARHLQLHRWMGRLYLGLGVLLGGVSGLFMAMHAYSGLTARFGFACLALA